MTVITSVASVASVAVTVVVIVFVPLVRVCAAQVHVVVPVHVPARLASLLAHATVSIVEPYEAVPPNGNGADVVPYVGEEVGAVIVTPNPPPPINGCG